MKICIVIALGTLVCTVAASGQGLNSRSARRAELDDIHRYVKGVDQFIKQNPKSQRIFANVASGATDEPDQWREFRNEDERANADSGENLNENAYVWIRNGRTTGANFTFQSPSRDWAHFVMYYFRDDGTLAKVESRLNTFYGNVSVKRVSFYGGNGRLLSGSTKCSDLYFGKPKACKDFIDEPIPLFHSVRSLPFYKSL